MRIAVGSDHAGLELKSRIVEMLREQGHDVNDVGTNDDSSVNYTDYAFEVSRLVVDGDADRGVLVCGTGLGMSMAANRMKGIRAALCTDSGLAEMSRRHNNSNVICLGGRRQKIGDVSGIMRVWLETPFEGGRHEKRLSRMDEVI